MTYIDYVTADAEGITFQIDGDTYQIDIADERPDMDLDPTLAIFRNDEEEPIATVHLSPEAPCYEPSHVIVRAKP